MGDWFIKEKKPHTSRYAIDIVEEGSKETMKRMRFLGFLLFLLFLGLIFPPGITPADQGGQVQEGRGGGSMLVDQWLMVGPFPLPLPAVLGEGAEFSLKDLLEFENLDPSRLWIKDGDSFEWSPEKTLPWKVQNAENGFLSFRTEGTGPQAAFLACYLDSSCWQKVKLELESHHLLRVFLDGISVVTKDSSSNPEAKERGSAEGELTLSQGKHRLFITAIRDPGGHPDWSLKASLSWKEAGRLASSLSVRRTLTEDDIFNSLRLSNVKLSPDGKAVAYTASRRNPRTKNQDSWIEIRSIPEGKIERVIRDSQSLRSLQWSPDGKFLSAIAPGARDTSDLWLIDRGTGQTEILLDDIKGLNNALWSPTGEFILYYVKDEPKEKEPKIQRLTGLQDRWVRFWPYKNHLYTVMIKSKVRRRLTAGTLPVAGTLPAWGMFNSTGNPISPDGRKVIFLISPPDYKNRPYARVDIMVLDLTTDKAERLFTSPFHIDSVSWSDNGRAIFFMGGQSIGDKKEKAPVSDFDTDLYVLNPETKEVTSLTAKFDPSIESALWAKDAFFLHCKDRSQSQLYKTDLAGERLTKLNTGVDVVSDFDVSADGTQIVYLGESIQTPSRLFALSSQDAAPRLVFAPEPERWSEVVFGKVEDFSFKNLLGMTIEGWLYYPLNFDPAKKYPLIVYYYGGSIATSRYFNARFLEYAANGYFVYVLNPSGAVGYGPEFSNLHVNDWGKIVADEIISGVTKVAAAKPFIDARRIGGWGASQGGFMTETVAYKTDLFRAFVSLNGISNLTSYWGAGWWAFVNHGIATAGSFPWNRPDIFADRSPIFHADKIKTPILLLHGDADINVPISESEQLFTALKLLGREVEFIRFRGEEHGIGGTDESQHAVPEIMLAWWDKYLKDQPEAWDNLWKRPSK